MKALTQSDLHLFIQTQIQELFHCHSISHDLQITILQNIIAQTYSQHPPSFNNHPFFTNFTNFDMSLLHLEPYIPISRSKPLVEDLFHSEQGNMIKEFVIEKEEVSQGIESKLSEDGVAKNDDEILIQRGQKQNLKRDRGVKKQQIRKVIRMCLMSALKLLDISKTWCGYVINICHGNLYYYFIDKIFSTSISNLNQYLTLINNTQSLQKTIEISSLFNQNLTTFFDTLQSKIKVISNKGLMMPSKKDVDCL